MIARLSSNETDCAAALFPALNDFGHFYSELSVDDRVSIITWSDPARANRHRQTDGLWPGHIRAGYRV